MYGSFSSWSTVGIFLDGRVAEPHGGVGIHAAQGQVLRHALDEPERRVHLDDGLHVGARAPPAPDVVLELVHHLVLQHVLQLQVGARERQDDPLLEEVGDAARPLARRLAAQRVGLLEVRVRGVEDDGLPLPVLVPEDLRQDRVRPLRHPPRVEGRLARLGVEVDVEVLGLEDLEVELPVLDLVLAEVLGGKQGGQGAEEQEAEPETTQHGNQPGQAPGLSSGASLQSRSSW
ncbi:MAG: hypothetical protein IPK12_10630 [Gemmatimonadetes bacterium]|nr:hypothetical protein [Gemmatimonadota bacterium]